MEDYYDLLGVPRDASTADIKKAYRERIKEEHPDVSDEDAASERTKQLIRAKEVLTDASERRRYDRIGHEAYVSEDTTATPRGSDTASATADAAESTASSGDGAGRSAGSQTGTTGSQTDESTETRETTRGTQTGENTEKTGETTEGTRTENSTQQNYGTGSQSWYNSSPGGGSSNSAEGTTATGSPAWDPERSYAVERESGNLKGLDIFSSERSLVLFLSTFLVYPVLLFGSLSPQFPLAVNLVVAACTVLVIAFLQSVPTVGMVVFGAWTLLLPPVLVFWIGVGPLSLIGVLAIASVGFPFGLSALTWLAIRPMSIT